MRRQIARRFQESAAATDGRVMSTRQFDAWFAERRERPGFQVRRIPFDRMPDWGFEPATGSLTHVSGRFFSVEGLLVRTDNGLGTWRQPILVQREIGILGIAVKEFDGVLHCLMQAKAEPGNSGTIRLSPTVQATRSNFTGVHRGRSIPLLEHFTEPASERVLVDGLQSERSTWFLRKRNRHMIVEVDREIPEQEDFCWLTLGQLRELMRRDNVLSMEACSVQACIPDPEPPVGPALHRTEQVVSRLGAIKASHEVGQDRIPLREATGWEQRDDEIARPDGRFFKVVAAEVFAESREVAHWTQPLVAPAPGGLIVLLTRSVQGVRHVLLHVSVEAGSVDVAEFGPTVQCTPSNYRDLPPERRPHYLDLLQSGCPGKVLYDAVLSEEGARFQHAESRYLIVDVGEDFPLDAPADFVWVTPHQIDRLLGHSYYLNMQARTLVSALRSVT